jgi:glycosyltransferase involved in cell wall biosynthesis
MPRVSIAVPVYNCERFVARSLESLLGQTYGDFELVISDNASTDGTEEICRSFAQRDKRVRYVRRTENIGGPGNFRYVFSLCTGEYHKWSTADDYWDPTYLEKGIAILDSQPDVVLAYGKTRLIDADGKTLQDYDDNLNLNDPSPRVRFQQLFARIGLCNAHLGVIRRSVMQRTQLIGAEQGSDERFLAEMSLYGKFVVIPEPLFFRRFHEQSSSWDRNNAAHQHKYYAPNAKKTRALHVLRRHYHLTGAAWRSPIPLSEKLGLSVDICKMLYWRRQEVGAELKSLFWSGRRA